MDWNQIEKIWAMMAKRMRAEPPCGKLQENMVAQPLCGNQSRPINSLIKEEVAVSLEIALKTSALSLR